MHKQKKKIVQVSYSLRFNKFLKYINREETIRGGISYTLGFIV